MDIKHMKYFIEVVKQGGMTNASKSLYIAQPTISKAIKDIENEMATPLFDRSKRHLILTDAGQIFYDKSKEIVALYDNLPVEMDRLYGLETGHINMGMSAVMNMKTIINILGAFHQLYPHVTYNLIENGGKTIEQQILNDEVDIGVTTLPVDHHIFDYTSLDKEDLRLIVSRSHKLAQYESVKMEDLAGEDFILFNEDFYLNDKIIENAKNVGFIPNMVAQISQWHVIEDLVTNELGISILPTAISQQLNENVKLLRIEDAHVHWELGVVWKKDKQLSHATTKWIEFLKQRLS
ncbi:cidABC operon transcriptional activator CidR [Staphylococcus simiae]|uniref:LysR substrate-binding protein n=1 Tax=Staphylococcus simiae CCM 7213 = CCUG 51256 TaxID=911238 RepID=G5JFT2_9STAP|nr:LysR family transcriptional regulator [Staphylococcus simiae]EHJ08950.1 LysR substrate-binding protein [Staphylococcus simiae CCM 7213 = CCUG 51256]PNZ12864.1 LysR family transcriptional regulator [Staphylococcus simiae]SNV82388.1 LysR family regulatory protein CidR [Staphylococcus simiae]